jgi:hypothetical protein
VYVQLRDDSEKMVADERLLAEEGCLRREAPHFLGRCARARAANRIEHGESAHMSNGTQLLHGAVDARDVRCGPWLVRLEEQQDRGCFGKDALERAGRHVVRIAGRDEPLQPAFRRDACCANGGQRYQHRI